ncbi:FAD-dependent thiol oxidase [Ceraceosorus guamensis]|uniref:Sulfhydryl oxidase n=1 Tax=Ceraceosorus guamensis TaxID=1522189 RepID=A0A316W939_9BASI|nr:FAD-dependent thiol oxidase [Ceraceosorus guamensis]PWN46094.1 FAD-dependent thiol oxidase [Ceraceosorus guamensis]
MPVFSRKPIGDAFGSSGGGSRNQPLNSRLSLALKRRPFLFFGLPFISVMAGASVALSYIAQTKFDYDASKVQSISKSEELKMRKDRKKIDIREEYFKLESDPNRSAALDDWEPKRVERPPGVPEWGIPADASPSLPPKRKGWFSSWASNKEVHADGGALPRLDEAGEEASSANASARKPGVILGPDGKPCRACNSKLAFSAAMRGTEKGGVARSSTSQSSSTPSKAAAASAGAGTSAAAVAATQSSSEQHTQHCPPDGEEIGRSTWLFLHSAAAYYPEEPTSIQKSAMLSLLRSLPHLYPCHSCAAALGEEYEREKREGTCWNARGGGQADILEQAVGKGQTLRRWLCGIHNEVNERLGKPVWECREEVLQERWRDGPRDDSCD